MSELPPSWKTCALEDLCDAGKQAIVDGPFGSNLKRSDYRSSGIPVLKIQNIKENRIVIKKMDFVSEVKFRELERHAYADGDIVMTKLGDPLGVSAIVGGIAPGLIVADLVRIRPASIDTRFLCYQLNSPIMRAFLNGQQKGTTRPRVNLSMVRELPVSVPPLAEQMRIIEVLEEQFSRLDTALASIRRVREKAVAFRLSLLEATFSPSRDDSGWSAMTLGDVAKWSSGGTPKSKTPEYYGGDIPWAVSGDLNNSWVRETTATITEAGIANSSAKVVPEGTVLVAMYGATIGKTGIASRPMATNQAVATAVVNEGIVTNEFLHYFLMSQRRLFTMAGQGMAQPNISQTILKSWRIAVPSLEFQENVVNRLGVQLAFVQKTLEMLRLLIFKLEGERRSMLHAAFSGTLTAQWRETHNG